MNAILMVSAILLVLVPSIFVWHKVYEDGLFGRIALCGIIYFSAVILLELTSNEGRYYILLSETPEVVWVIASFTLFTIWHLCRFHWRVLKEEKKAKAEAWKERRSNKERREKDEHFEITT